MSAEEVLHRDTCEYKNLSSKFVLPNTDDFNRQFAPMYMMRLKTIRESLKALARKKWGQDVPIIELYQLQDGNEDPKKCIIVGTLYKNQSLKPNILKEVSEEHQLEATSTLTFFADDSDSLVLEDELQRIALCGNINVQQLVTGIVIAVLGTDDRQGNFTVEDCCFPTPKERVHKPLAGPDKYVLLVSGLSIGNPNSGDGVMCAEILLEFLRGQAGSPEDQERMSHVVRAIFAGNSLQDHPQANMGTRQLRNVDAQTQEMLMSSARRLDDYFAEMLTSIDVDILPGEFDPCSQMLPQQPFHPCIFPKSTMFNTLHLVTNPYKCEVGNCLILGSSGQPVSDIHSFCKVDNRLDVLENCIRWGHMAPTCPDTLYSYPCFHNDPFMIEDCPDIFFAGNQPEFQTRTITTEKGQRVCLVCIPSFSKTQTAVMVNINTLDCHPLSFSIDLPKAIAER
ncbi:DNA polymerase delta subunit 2 [Neocloeon triangulifer]|uniref:DNA polymerase delta subunit 2 n=1 Tax=Neocloeon triangulifer TaxID=2078957 RepID=UPI00286FA4EF|nr:DNA polymerase delta subunit 2 [Neocloeon triangulifer]